MLDFLTNTVLTRYVRMKKENGAKREDIASSLPKYLIHKRALWRCGLHKTSEGPASRDTAYEIRE